MWYYIIKCQPQVQLNPESPSESSGFLFVFVIVKIYIVGPKGATSGEEPGVDT